MVLVKIKLILEIAWLTLKIAILVKNNFLKLKKTVAVWARTSDVRKE